MMIPATIKEMIDSFTLFSPEMNCVFNDKEFTVYTLKTLLILDEITDDMLEDMRIDVEESIKLPDKRRGSRLDVLISFPKHRINIEIQRIRNKDEIYRAAFYLGKMATSVDEGVDQLEHMDYISAWICDFDPFPDKALPYYQFSPTYHKKDGIRGVDESFELGNGIKYIFINGRYKWDSSALTDKEIALRDYILDMRQSLSDNIRNKALRDAFSFYKEGGAMYNKWAIDFRDRYKEFFDNVEKEAFDEGFKSNIKNLIRSGLSDSDISRYSCIPIEEVSAIRRSLIL